LLDAGAAVGDRGEITAASHRPRYTFYDLPVGLCRLWPALASEWLVLDPATLGYGSPAARIPRAVRCSLARATTANCSRPYLVGIRQRCDPRHRDQHAAELRTYSLTYNTSGYNLTCLLPDTLRCQPRQGGADRAGSVTHHSDMSSDTSS